MPAPFHLMVDLQNMPVGVHAERARFSWRVPDVVAEQAAYQVQIFDRVPMSAADGALAEEDVAAVWDSGRRDGPASVSVPLEGLGLRSSTAYWWRVRLWAETSGTPGAWSAPARMVTAVPGAWPATPIWGTSRADGASTVPRCVIIRHEFDLPDGEIAAAFIETLGDSPIGARQYVATIWCNQRTAGRASVRPLTDETRYHTLDVTGVVRPGRPNAIAALCWAEHGHRFAAQLVVQYTDGRRHTVSTAPTWRSFDGEAMLPGEDMLEGGWYRAPREHWTMTAVRPGWTAPGYDETGWSSAVERPACGRLEPAIANIEESFLAPASITGPVCVDDAEELDSASARLRGSAPSAVLQRWVVDFGAVLAGGIRMRVHGTEGDTIRVVLGEELEDENAQSAREGAVRTVRSPLRGGNIYDETWTLRNGPQEITHWGYRGFRYAAFTCAAGIDPVRDVQAVRLRSADLDSEAAFASSDPALVRVWDLCRDTIEATALDLFQDTPTRERGPYEGDQYVNQLGQYAVGGGYALARYSHRYLTHNPTWPIEYRLMQALCAWEDYLVTGDPETLAEGFDTWVAHNRDDEVNADGLVEKEPDPDGREAVREIVDWPVSNRDDYEFTRVNTVVNAFQCVAYDTLSRIATVLGRREDAEAFAARAASMTASLNGHLLDPRRAVYVDGVGTAHSAQHATAVPAALGLVPEDMRAAVGTALAAQGVRTSIYAVQFLLDGLYRTGQDRAALAVMTGRGVPGWVDAMDRLGATLTPEAWDPSMKPNMSFSHAWGSAPINVVHRRLVGLTMLEPGAARVLVRPQPGDLTWFRATLPTIRGPITVDWDARPGHARCIIDVPGNTVVDAELPVAATASQTRGDRISRHGLRAGRTVIPLDSAGDSA